MVSRSTAAMIARKKKATLKKAAIEREIILEAWGERERDLSNESDGAGGSRQEGRDGGGGEC
jgi:hypothetical protein